MCSNLSKAVETVKGFDCVDLIMLQTSCPIWSLNQGEYNFMCYLLACSVNSYYRDEFNVFELLEDGTSSGFFVNGFCVDVSIYKRMVKIMDLINCTSFAFIVHGERKTNLKAYSKEVIGVCEVFKEVY